jgi:hypothetical protein
MLSYLSQVVLMSFLSTLLYSPWSVSSINYFFTESCILPICHSLWTLCSLDVCSLRCSSIVEAPRFLLLSHYFLYKISFLRPNLQRRSVVL